MNIFRCREYGISSSDSLLQANVGNSRQFYNFNTADVNIKEATCLKLLSQVLLFPLSFILPLPNFLCGATVSICTAIVLASGNEFEQSAITKEKHLRLIGDMSYSLHLSFWTCLFALSAGTTETWRAVEVSLLLFAINHNLIENYLRNMRTWKVIAFSIFVIYLSFQSTIFKEVNGNLSSWKQRYNLSHTRSDSERPPGIIRFQAVQLNEKLLAGALPLFFQGDEFTADTKPFGGYQYSLKGYTKGNGTISVAIFGNSFAFRAFHSIVHALDNNFYDARLLATAGCEPFYDVPYERFPDCWNFVNTSIKIMEASKPDLVVIVYRPMTTCEPIRANMTDKMVLNMQKTIDKISTFSRWIVLVYPSPVSDKDNYASYFGRLLARNKPMDDLNIPFKYFWKTHRFAIERLDSLSCPKCVRFIQHRWFCDSKVCRSYDPKTFLTFYTDGAHLSEHALRLLMPQYKRLFLESFKKWRPEDSGKESTQLSEGSAAKYL